MREHAVDTGTDLGFAWLLAALRGEEPPWPTGDSLEPSKIIELAASNKVTCLCHFLTRHSGAWSSYPSQLQERLDREVRQAMVSEQAWREQVLPGLKCLVDAGLHPVLMGGAALAYGFYPESYLRPHDGIEALFQSRRLADQALQVLEAHGFAANLD